MKLIKLDVRKLCARMQRQRHTIARRYRRIRGVTKKLPRTAARQHNGVGVDLILATVTNADAMGALFGGLRPQGKLLVVGADPSPLPIPAAALIAGSKQIAGHASGTSIDSEDTLRFSALSDVRAMIETMPLERASEAYDKMMRGDARFRMVLTTD